MCAPRQLQRVCLSCCCRRSPRRFLDAIPCLCPAQLERLRGDLVELSDPDHPANALWHEFHSNEAPAESGTVLMHALGAWRISEAFHDLLFHPALLVPAIQAMGLCDKRGVRLLHDQLFCKPARAGAVVAWHQDLSYWTRFSPSAFLTVHVALDDQSSENGALHYVAGSHRWPLLPVTSRHFGDMESIRSVLDREQAAQLDACRCVRLRAGQVSIHHPLSVHGSFGNRSAGPRRAAVVNLAADGVVINTSRGPVLSGAPDLPKGTPLGGFLHPLLGSMPAGAQATAAPPCSVAKHYPATDAWADEDEDEDASAGQVTAPGADA